MTTGLLNIIQVSQLLYTAISISGTGYECENHLAARNIRVEEYAYVDIVDVNKCFFNSPAGTWG